MFNDCGIKRDCALCHEPIGKKEYQIQVVKSSGGGPYLIGAHATHFVSTPSKVPEHLHKKLEEICDSAVEYVHAGMRIREAVEAAKKLHGWEEWR